ALLFVVPLAIVLLVSFGSTDLVNRPVYGFHPENYADVFDGIYLKVLVQTVIYAIVTALISVVLGYPTAYAIAVHGGRAKGILVGLLLLPWVVNFLVRVYAWIAILGDGGIVNELLRRLGVHGDPPVHFLNTPWAVLGGLVYGYFPFVVLPIYAALEQFDTRLIEAGKDLYGSPRAVFWKVTWPLTRGATAVGALLVLLPVLGDFATARLLGGPETYMVGNVIESQFLQSGYPPTGSALSIVLLVLLLLTIGLARRAGSVRSALRRTL
ncbi:MAG: ABC transporter permease, partial [Janthinobacterium lividum]